MISASFFIYNGFYHSFEIKGHANYDADGKDIICAAVSSAVDMTINALLNIINQDCNVKINREKAIVSLYLKNNKNQIASLFIKSLCEHLIHIKKVYPKNLQLNINNN